MHLPLTGATVLVGVAINCAGGHAQQQQQQQQQHMLVSVDRDGERERERRGQAAEFLAADLEEANYRELNINECSSVYLYYT